MATITIEGSLTPASNLPRGERRVVADTTDARRYVAKGYAVVVDEDDAPVPAPDPFGQPVTDEDAPARNASRDDWAEFLARHPHGFVTDGKNREQLIAEWDDYLAGAEGGDTDGINDAG